MEIRSLGFRTDLMVRRLAGSSVTDHGSYIVVRTPANPTFWWGNFVLLASPPQAGELGRWLGTFAAAFPGAGHVALGMDGIDGAVGNPAERARYGLVADVATVLSATALVAPAHGTTGAVVRPLDGEDDWAQAHRLRLETADRPPTPEHRQFAGRRVAEARALVVAGGAAWFGAFVGGVLRCTAGLVRGADGTARYQHVETDPVARRRGLASAVVYALGVWGLRSAGARRLVIVADTDGEAVRVYRALGFAGTERQARVSRGPESGGG